LTHRSRGDRAWWHCASKADLMPSDQNQSENDGSKRDSHGPCQDEEKWIKEYKDKVDQAVDKWMAEQKIEEAPLDKLLKSLVRD